MENAGQCYTAKVEHHCHRPAQEPRLGSRVMGLACGGTMTCRHQAPKTIQCRPGQKIVSFNKQRTRTTLLYVGHLGYATRTQLRLWGDLDQHVIPRHSSHVGTGDTHWDININTKNTKTLNYLGPSKISWTVFFLVTLFLFYWVDGLIVLCIKMLEHVANCWNTNHNSVWKY